MVALILIPTHRIIPLSQVIAFHPHDFALDPISLFRLFPLQYGTITIPGTLRKQQPTEYSEGLLQCPVATDAAYSQLSLALKAGFGFGYR